MPSSPRRNYYIPELDGIRGLAVCMVFADHMLGGWATPADTLARVPALVRFILGHGWLGVDLFFVLSGFLITGILLDSREKPNYFRNFYARRFLRIIPLYYTVIAVMWLCYGGPARYFVLSYLFLANFASAFRANVPHGAGVFWSLAVEEHFYLLWPLLVRILSRRNLALFAFGVVVFVPTLRLWAESARISYEAIYSYSYFRFDGLALGALLAIWVRTPWANQRTSCGMTAGLLLAAAVLTVAGIPFGILAQKSVLRFTQAQLVFAALITGAVALQGTVFSAAFPLVGRQAGRRPELLRLPGAPRHRGRRAAFPRRLSRGCRPGRDAVPAAARGRNPRDHARRHAALADLPRTALPPPQALFRKCSRTRGRDRRRGGRGLRRRAGFRYQYSHPLLFRRGSNDRMRRTPGWGPICSSS
jgi:peptidoglycan/LPS O-acetylase OafA/YrhL